MKASQGEGRRLLLGLVLLTSAICAWLPNAATVLLIGPLLPPLARELDLDPRPLLILLVLTANSAGLLTVIGDPATYLVASQIGLGFLAYGQPGGERRRPQSVDGAAHPALAVPQHLETAAACPAAGSATAAPSLGLHPAAADRAGDAAAVPLG